MPSMKGVRRGPTLEGNAEVQERGGANGRRETVVRPEVHEARDAAPEAWPEPARDDPRTTENGVVRIEVLPSSDGNRLHLCPS